MKRREDLEVTEKTTMTSLFDDLCTGLDQAIEFAKGTGEAKVTHCIIEPVKKYNQKEIKSIRNRHGFSQSVFANYMGVSKKTVEAWECGRNTPTGPACRLLHILDANMGSNFPFVKLENEYSCV